MTVGELVKAALSDIAPVAHNMYLGTEDRYYVYTYDETGAFYADNRLAGIVNTVQVSFLCPLDFDAEPVRELTRSRLIDAGFVWSETISAGIQAKTAGDGGVQMFTFVCQVEFGVYYDG